MVDYSTIIFYLIPLFKSKYIRHFNSITNYRNKKQFLSNVKKRVNNNVSNLFYSWGRVRLKLYSVGIRNMSFIELF